MRLETARNQNHLRYSAGIALLFGGEKPLPPAPRPPVATACPDGKTVPPTPSLGSNRGGVTYRIAVNASGCDHNPASADVDVALREYLPPTGTAQANPGDATPNSILRMCDLMHPSTPSSARTWPMSACVTRPPVITGGTGICLSIPSDQVLVSAPGLSQQTRMP